MPWHVAKKGSQFCVIKDSDGSSAGCHGSRAKAVKQMRALYANEPSMRGSILASMPPLVPPREWFDLPEAKGPTPLTITKEGQVYGHLALWDTCHTGLMTGDFGQCIKPPRSQTDYSYFHLGTLETDQGDVSVGKLVYDTTHAPITANLQDAGRHYDKTGAVGAFIRARDGKHGIWAAGAVRSDISQEGFRDLRANPPSGDWRLLNGNLELVGALAVNVPGFPIPLSLAASADGGMEVSALILPGPCDCEEEEVLTAAVRSREYLRRKRALMSAWNS